MEHCHKSRKFRKIGLFFGLLASIAALASVSGCSKKSPQEKVEWVSSKITNELDLTPAQQQKLLSLSRAIGEQITHGHQQHQADFENIKKLIRSEAITKDQIEALMKEKQKRFDSSLDVIYPKLEEFHQILDQEQKEKLISMLEKLKNKFH